MSTAITSEAAAPPAVQPLQSNHSLRIIPVSQLVPSQTNPDSRCQGAEFDELVESVRLHGVIVPILVRPFGALNFEIVAGERRFRAAVKAGKPALPAMVRELTDLEAHELQLIENLQRKDITPLEEAQGYADLMASMAKEDAGRPLIERMSKQEQVQFIADRIGKSVRYVWARMKLVQLVPEAQQALREGRMEASHADILVTYPAEKQREIFFDNFCEAVEDKQQAATAVFKDVKIGGCQSEDLTWAKTTPSVRDLKYNLQREGLELKRAPWKWAKDIETKPAVPGATPCVGCEFNTASQEGGDAKHALCLNDECFDAKKAKLLQIQIDAATAKDGKAPIRITESHYENSKGVLNHSNWEKASPGSCDSVVAAAQFGYNDKLEKFLHVCTNKKCKVHFKKPETSRTAKSPEQVKQEAELKAENAARLAIAKRVVGAIEVLPPIVVRHFAQVAAEDWHAREQVGRILPTAKVDLKSAKDDSKHLAKAVVAVMLAPFSEADDYRGASHGRKEFDAAVQKLGFNIAKERASLAGANVAVAKAAPPAAKETASSKRAATKTPAKASPKTKAAPSKATKKKSAKKGGR